MDHAHPTVQLLYPVNMVHANPTVQPLHPVEVNRTHYSAPRWNNSSVTSRCDNRIYPGFTQYCSLETNRALPLAVHAQSMVPFQIIVWPVPQVSLVTSHKQKVTYSGIIPMNTIIILWSPSIQRVLLTPGFRHRSVTVCPLYFIVYFYESLCTFHHISQSRCTPYLTIPIYSTGSIPTVRACVTWPVLVNPPSCSYMDVVHFHPYVSFRTWFSHHLTATP